MGLLAIRVSTAKLEESKHRGQSVHFACWSTLSLVHMTVHQSRSLSALLEKHLLSHTVPPLHLSLEDYSPLQTIN